MSYTENNEDFSLEYKLRNNCNSSRHLIDILSKAHEIVYRKCIADRFEVFTDHYEDQRIELADALEIVEKFDEETEASEVADVKYALNSALKIINDEHLDFIASSSKACVFLEKEEFRLPF